MRSNNLRNIVCDYDGYSFIWNAVFCFGVRCELDALCFHLYLGTQADWQTQGTPELLTYLLKPRNAEDYVMDTFPIVKRKDEKEYGEYRTKLRILEIYDQMTHIFDPAAVNVHSPLAAYHSLLDPPPGPLCDENGIFIPMEQWDINNWPKHIHLDN